MWQIAIAAAIAGSGLLASKKLFNPTKTNRDSSFNCDQQQLEVEEDHSSNGVLNAALESPTTPLKSPISAQSSFVGEEEEEEEEKESIFRFSSSGSRNDHRRSRTVLKGLRKKKLGIGVIRGSNGGVETQKAVRSTFVCLKKKTSAKLSSVNSASPLSKDSSVFGWGVGVGIMYMMSAGKAEISKLNTAMDETTKVVKELKDELYKRKSSTDPQNSRPITQCDTISKKFKDKHTEPVFSRSVSNNRNLDIFNLSSPHVPQHGECGSSSLTEERGSDGLEMDQLEAELESELQKLSCCTAEASLPEGRTSDFSEEAEISKNGIPEQKDLSLTANQFHGVTPYELNRKLSRLLIGQQESQIVELESELQSAHSKLNEKEAELQALKDRVRRLTEFSLSTVSDKDMEVNMGQENKMTPDPNKQVDENEVNKTNVE